MIVQPVVKNFWTPIEQSMVSGAGVDINYLPADGDIIVAFEDLQSSMLRTLIFDSVGANPRDLQEYKLTKTHDGKILSYREENEKDPVTRQVIKTTYDFGVTESSGVIHQYLFTKTDYMVLRSNNPTAGLPDVGHALVDFCKACESVFHKFYMESNNANADNFNIARWNWRRN